MELGMKWSDVASISAICGALMLAGCSKEPASESANVAASQTMPSPDADVSEVLGDGDSIANAVHCLGVGLPYSKEGIEELLQLPREPIAAKIPASELVYWGKSGRDGGSGPSSMGYCEAKFSKEELDSYQGDHYVAERARSKATEELQETAMEELKANPFGVFNAVVKNRQSGAVTFEPSPKGDFEKSIEYAARIAREKEAFDKVNSSKKITLRDIEFVWLGIFGLPSLKTDDWVWNSQRDVYDPDTETLSLTIVSRGISKFDPVKKEVVPHYHFEIPVKIKLTPDQAQKLFTQYPLRGDGGIEGLRPVVAMQLHKGVLTVREVSFKDYGMFAEENFEKMGYRLENIPMNVELSRNVLPEL